MDVERAADLYAQGPTLRQIATDLGVTETTVSEHLRRAGVTMRRGAPAHPASTQQILQLRDRGLTWNEVAKRVDMTVSGVWSRYRRARLQLVVALRRRAQLGNQVPLLLANGASILIGVAFIIAAAVGHPRLSMLAIYAATGGIEFVIQAWLLARRRRRLTSAAPVPSAR